MSAKSTSLNTFEWLRKQPRLANTTKASALNCLSPFPGLIGTIFLPDSFTHAVEN